LATSTYLDCDVQTHKYLEIMVMSCVKICFSHKGNIWTKQCTIIGLLVHFSYKKQKMLFIQSSKGNNIKDWNKFSTTFIVITSTLEQKRYILCIVMCLKLLNLLQYIIFVDINKNEKLMNKRLYSIKRVCLINE